MIRTVAGSCPNCGPEFERRPVARGEDYEYRTTGSEKFEFVECVGCGTWVLDPRPADEEIAGLYPPNYEPYLFSKLPRLVRIGRDRIQIRKVRAIARWLPPKATVVDVGCGAGALLRLLKDHGPADARLVGWDFPGPHLERLTEQGFEVLAAPITSASEPPEADAFVLNQVIEHFAEPDRLLDVLHRALRPGGLLFVETPRTDSLDARWFRSGHWGGYHFPRHLVLFDEGNLARLVESKGFRVVERARLPSPAFWIQSLHHALDDRGYPRLARFFVIRNPFLVAFFTLFDLVVGRFRATSNQRLVAVRT